MPALILASQSPQRAAMLKTLHLPFKTAPANIDEAAITATTHQERAQKVALAKAKAVAKKFPKAIILAGDTYVVLNDEALEKPANLDQARAMLHQLSGATSVEYTGVCYLDPARHLEISDTIETQVTFRQLTEAEIEHYVTTEPVTTWSAAFCPAYTNSAVFIERIEGSFTNFTHGLPVEFVVPRLKKAGMWD